MVVSISMGTGISRVGLVHEKMPPLYAITYLRAMCDYVSQRCSTAGIRIAGAIVFDSIDDGGRPRLSSREDATAMCDNLFQRCSIAGIGLRARFHLIL